MKSLVDSGNFKHPDHKLKTMGANMPLSKAVLLMSARLPQKTVHALKISSGRPGHPQNKVMSRSLRGQFLFCRRAKFSGILLANQVET